MTTSTKYTDRAAAARKAMETAEQWYAGFGWSLQTRRCGDVELQVVDYRDLDGSDAEAVDRLCEGMDGLRRSEAEEIVDKAREIRDMADSVESVLGDAIDAYERGDIAGAAELLGDAHREEDASGGTPSTTAVADELHMTSDCGEYSPQPEPQTYTYTIFDAPAAGSGDVAWPHATQIEVEADSAEEAIEEAMGALASGADDCRRADGYTVGQRIYVTVWDESGAIVHEGSVELTEEHLGEDEEVAS